MPNADERRSPRRNVVLQAVLDCAGRQFHVRVSNLSAHGAFIVADVPLPAETEINFRCKGVARQSWVTWSRERHAGIHFAEPLDVEQLRRKSREPGPVITRDTRVTEARRPGFRGNQMTAEERQMLEEWRQSELGRSAGS